MAPDYIAQTCEAEHTATPEDRRAWVAARAEEARAEGCTWPRHSWSDFMLVGQGTGPTLTTCLLFEGWRVRPQQAEPPAWQFAASDTKPKEPQ